MNRRTFLGAAACAGVGVLLAPAGAGAADGRVLYNGIELPSIWPPEGRQLSDEPETPPYLSAPPDVIPIDLGRQLFVDDFLIEQTDLSRVFHAASYYAGNPVLVPDRPWEQAESAMPFSDGVVFDPTDRLFKCWYLAGLTERSTCLAISSDGIRWRKPDFGIVAGTNVVWPSDLIHGRDSQTVWRDPFDRSRPYKLGSSGSARPYGSHWLLESPDGVRWTKVGETPAVGDRTTLFFNPFRKVWVFSIRTGGEVQGPPRHRLYVESPTFIPSEWKPVVWAQADRLDELRSDTNTRPQLYNLDCVAYESVLLGLFTLWRGDHRTMPKPNDVCVGFSRDGFHWWRPDRRAFIGLGQQGEWNFGNVQSAGGCCLVVGDELRFYVSGRAGIAESDESGRCTTGIAFLRRDGFASLEAGDSPGSLLTRPVRFTGRHLFVNAEVAGELRVEVIDRNGRAIAPFTAETCVPVVGNATKQMVYWRGADNLARVAGEPVRFRFVLSRGRLYAFWVSPSPAGTSLGYLGAGGPSQDFYGRDTAE